MSVPLNNGDVIEVRNYCSLFLQQGINVLHYRVSNAVGTPVTDAATVTLMAASFAPLYKAYLPAAARWEGMRLQKVNPLPLPVASITTVTAGVGAVASDALPPVVSLLVSKRTALAGPKGRGRLYLPFWPESLNDASGVPTGGAVTAAVNLTNVMLTAITITSGGGSVLLTPILFNKVTRIAQDITSLVIRTQWSHMIRRSALNRPDVIGPTP